MPHKMNKETRTEKAAGDCQKNKEKMSADNQKNKKKIANACQPRQG